jgi:hypothetical protein
MEPDPIVEEVRAIRDAFAKECNYDIAAIVRALQKAQRDQGTKTVSLPPRRVPRDEGTRKAG